MKKILFFILLFFLAFTMFSCQENSSSGEEQKETIDFSEYIYIEDQEITYDGDLHELSYKLKKILPEGYKVEALGEIAYTDPGDYRIIYLVKDKNNAIVHILDGNLKITGEKKDFINDSENNLINMKYDLKYKNMNYKGYLWEHDGTIYLVVQMSGINLAFKISPNSIVDVIKYLLTKDKEETVDVMAKRFAEVPSEINENELVEINQSVFQQLVSSVLKITTTDFEALLNTTYDDENHTKKIQIDGLDFYGVIDDLLDNINNIFGVESQDEEDKVLYDAAAFKRVVDELIAKLKVSDIQIIFDNVEKDKDNNYSDGLFKSLDIKSYDEEKQVVDHFVSVNVTRDENKEIKTITGNLEVEKLTGTLSYDVDNSDRLSFVISYDEKEFANFSLKEASVFDDTYPDGGLYISGNIKNKYFVKGYLSDNQMQLDVYEQEETEQKTFIKANYMHIESEELGSGFEASFELHLLGEVYKVSVKQYDELGSYEITRTVNKKKEYINFDYSVSEAGLFNVVFKMNAFDSGTIELQLDQMARLSDTLVKYQDKAVDIVEFIRSLNE